VAGTYKKSYLIDLRTLKCLSKYLFRERKLNNILER
jgi:hypothetical protein